MGKPGAWVQRVDIGMEFFFSKQNKEWGKEEPVEVYGKEKCIKAWVVSSLKIEPHRT